MISKVSNVSIEDCQISNFSFGILSANSNHALILNNNISQNYVSEIDFINSSINYVANNYISKSSSGNGAVNITNNSRNNGFMNNLLQFNDLYGFVVNVANNTFLNNSVQSTPISFYCTGNAGFKHSNSAFGNRCYNNTGCNFLSCTGFNNPTNVAGVVLTPTVNSCGSIKSPGTYKLIHNISMSYYINTSTASSPCITIASNYVTLDCNGYSITNATTAIAASNVIHTNIQNCKISNSNNGIVMNYVSNTNITNTLFENNSLNSLEIKNSNTARITNLSSYGSYYGLNLINTKASLLNEFNLKNNTFGIYLSNGSVGNSFLNGISINNTRVDVYATSDSANSTDNIMQKSTCGLSDTNWANCLQYVSESLQYYPLYQCGALSRSGTYKLLNNIISTRLTCFNFKQNNVILDCGNYKIVSPLQNGPAVNITKHDNITLENCSISGYGPSIIINKSKNIKISNNLLNNSGISVMVNNSKFVNVSYNNLSMFGNYGVALLNTTKSIVEFNKINRDTKNNTGIFIKNSTLNSILNNTVTSTTGIYLFGKSNNNTISDNFVNSGNIDFKCSKSNDPITAEYGGINYGTVKDGCTWLALVSQNNPYVGCTSTINPSLFSLTNDYEYSFGTTCFNIYSNNTVINCNGHTIIATNGGTFANFVKSQNVNLENCNLKGFSNPVIGTNLSYLTIQNNTFYINSSIPINTQAVNITNTKSITLQNNLVLAPYYGFVLNNVSYGSILNNNISAYSTAYSLYAVNGIEISGNKAPYYGTTGALLANSSSDKFQNNNFSGIYGLYCKGISTNSTYATDLGQNICTNNFNCNWVQSSLQNCPRK